MAKNIKKISGISISIILLAFIIVSLNFVVITKENEFTLVKQFNKIDRVITKAGLSYKMPFVETIDKLPKQIQLYDMPKSDVITMDKKTMVADNYVMWKISDPSKFAQTLNSSVTIAESRINTTVYNAMKNVISSLSQNEVISGRDGELSQSFMDNIGDSMEQYGIHLISVETKHLDLPSDNKIAVFERMISERAQMAATYTAEGESEAQKIRNITDKEIAISLSNAHTQAAKIIAEAESEYMRILSETYSDTKRSEFYIFARSLDAARASLIGGNKTLILSSDSPIAQIFNTIK